jgi:delta-aminolevulinic acid dehydratase/porphobilinogen synthase
MVRSVVPSGASANVATSLRRAGASQTITYAAASVAAALG